MRFGQLLSLSFLVTAATASALPKRDGPSPVTKEITLPNGRTQNITFLADFTPDEDAPTPDPAGNTKVKRVSWADDSNDWDLCGTSTFNNKWNADAPRVDNCRFLQEYFETYKGYFRIWAWDVDNAGVDWTPLVYAGTCQFGVRGRPTPAYVAWIGNTDIADLVRDSISKFGRDNHVGAEGRMGCQQHMEGQYGQWQNDWAVQTTTADS